MRGRRLSPAIFRNERFVELSPAAKVFLIGLGLCADWKGRLKWQPKTLVRDILVEGDAEELLTELDGLANDYTVDGNRYLYLPCFDEFFGTDGAEKKPSAFPAPPGVQESLWTSVVKTRQDEVGKIGKRFIDEAFRLYVEKFGRKMLLTAADTAAAYRLTSAYAQVDTADPLVDLRRWWRRYLSDPDPFLSSQGKALRHFPRAVEVYITQPCPRCKGRNGGKVTVNGKEQTCPECGGVGRG